MGIGMETTFILWTWNEALKQWDFHAKYPEKDVAETTAKQLPRQTAITPVMLPTKPKGK
jgi:hypothetical protein